MEKEFDLSLNDRSRIRMQLVFSRNPDIRLSELLDLLDKRDNIIFWNSRHSFPFRVPIDYINKRINEIVAEIREEKTIYA